MFRFLISVIILTLLITYAIIPFVKYITKFFNKEAKRLDKSLTNINTKNDEENENEL